MKRITRLNQAGELKETIFLFLLVAVPLLWTCFYFLHRGVVETQSVIDQSDRLRHARHSDEDLDRLTQLSPEMVAQLANAPTPPPDDSKEEDEESDSTAPELPSTTANSSPALVHRLQSMLTPSASKVEAPAGPPVDNMPSPPVAIFKPRDDDSDGSNARDVVWAHAPKNFTPSSGDFIHVQAPGVDLSGIKVTGVANDQNGVTWLLQVDAADVAALQKIIRHRPKTLRVSSEES